MWLSCLGNKGVLLAFGDEGRDAAQRLQWLGYPLPKIYMVLNASDAEVRKPCPEVVGAKEAQGAHLTPSGG